MVRESEGTSEEEFPQESEEFSELIKYTLPGYVLGLLAGVFWTSRVINGVLPDSGLFVL